MGDGAAPGACPLPARLKNDVNVPALLPKKLLVLRARARAHRCVIVAWQPPPPQTAVCGLAAAAPGRERHAGAP